MAHHATPAFRFAILPVNPGDFDTTNPDNPNTKFRRLNGLRGAFNRAIDPVAVSKLAQDWDSVVNAGSPLVLWQEKPEDSHYFIISGQHRIMAAADAVKYKLPVGSQFKVEIRTPASIEKAGSLAHQVFVANLHARRQDGPQDMEIFQGESPWTVYAKKIGLNPCFTSEQNQDQMSWKAIIHAALVLRAIRKDAAIFNKVMHFGHDAITEEFQHPKSNVKEVLDTILLWEVSVCRKTDSWRRLNKARLR